MEIVNFTPVPAFAGGLLIGAGALVLMASMGRVMGASSILDTVQRNPFNKDNSWRWAFIIGVLLGPILYMGFTGQVPTITLELSMPLLLIGGIVVGIGSRMGNGCTSGHGICGMARLSVRSIVATCTFMATTGLTVYVMRHMLGS